MKRRDFLRSGCAAITAALAAPHLSAVQPDHKKTAVRELAVKNKEIRLLQFTDIHFFIRYAGDFAQSAAENAATAETLQRLTSLADPHLILVTGDFWHDNPDGKGLDFLAYGAEVMAGLKRPWIFTWGNHDQVSDLPRAHQLLKNAPGCLYAGDRSARLQAYTDESAPEKSVWELTCALVEY